MLLGAEIMPSFLKDRSIRTPLYWLYAMTIVFLGILAYYNWAIAAIGLIISTGVFYFILKKNILRQQQTEEYIATLSYRLKKVGEEALLQMPIGIMLINDDYFIEWTNPFLASCFAEDSLAGRSLYDIAESLIPLIKQDIEMDTVTLNERQFKVIHKREERLLYFFDVTERVEIEKMYEDERTVIATIYLDNYDDLTQGMDDQRKSSLNSLVTSLLDKWAKENGVFLKRTSSERFITVFNEHTLHHLEKGQFAILDEIRETTAKQNVPLTLSIGVGSSNVSSLPELGVLAQSSLDLALSRGGDQVAIKQSNGKVKFFGGKTNPMEKRTRVRARVISHALKDIVLESDKVIVMGHKYPDMDAIGSAIGILKVAQLNEREGYIVMDSQIDTSVRRLMEEIEHNSELYRRFISPEDALEILTEETVLVVVDTHKPSMVIDERVLNRIDKRVLIDHHRRGEEFIQNPLLVYMEPYASSTAELVTELLEYQPKGIKMDMLEATALLSGIIVDTKSFTLRTGSRTFDAASYLRARGADTVLVQKFLKEDIHTFIERAKLIEDVTFYREGIAIAIGRDNTIHNQVLIAQAADTLLTMDGIVASFVLAKRSEDIVGISARSLGDINVQIIMEMLNGGGHLTNAATQQSCSIEEAELKLMKAIDEYLEGGQKE